MCIGKTQRVAVRSVILSQIARYRKTKTSSKYRGVWYNKQTKKWRATIVVNRKRKQIGYFSDEVEAAKAYDEAAKRYHKDFAVLNFPPK